MIVLTISNFPISALETGQPLWITELSGKNIMFKGFSFLPTTMGYWCATSFLVKIIDKFKSVVSTSSAGIVSMFFGLMLYTANGEFTQSVVVEIIQNKNCFILIHNVPP